MTVQIIYPADRQCTVEGCGRPARAHGLCQTHYMRFRRRGTTALPTRVAATCKIDGCEKPAKSHGWCSAHYTRWRRRGDPMETGDWTTLNDLTGQRFGRLLVLCKAPRKNRKTYWQCKCDCGNDAIVPARNLVGPQRTQSCGCLTKEATRQRNTIHGESGSPEYVSWRAMKDRCFNPNHEKYPVYGGRGITVCDRWADSFANFLADLGRKPTPQHTMDRYPDNDGNYEPGNCRWATATEQRLNQARMADREVRHDD